MRGADAELSLKRVRKLMPELLKAKKLALECSGVGWLLLLLAIWFLFIIVFSIGLTEALILSPDFLFIGFEEKTLEKCLESENFQTWKQSEKTRRVNLVRGEFLDYLKNNYTSQAQEVKTKFKIISVSGDDKSFASRVLTSISLKSKSHIIDERSEWLINWENKKQGSNITKIEIQKLEKTKKYESYPKPTMVVK